MVLEQFPEHPEGLHGELPGGGDDHHAGAVAREEAELVDLAKGKTC